jgi:hypothetical protein
MEGRASIKEMWMSMAGQDSSTPASHGAKKLKSGCRANKQREGEIRSTAKTVGSGEPQCRGVQAMVGHSVWVERMTCRKINSEKRRKNTEARLGRTHIKVRSWCIHSCVSSL